MAKYNSIYDSIFGSDLSPDIRKELDKRQNLSGKLNATSTYDATSNFMEGPVNILNSVSSTRNAAFMSDKAVWARMWTGVRQVEKVEGDSKTGLKNYDWRCYVVGNNIYKDYQDNKLLPSPAGSQLAYNRFDKPSAGITSISTDLASEGKNHGAIINVTINFSVFNLFDYEQIFMKYFLKPQAKIFVDYGWNKSDIYDPYEIVGDKDWVEKIYKVPFTNDENSSYGWQGSGLDAGFGSKVKGGVISNSGGNIEVLHGNVQNFNSKVRPDGGFDCTLTFLSGNYALLDRHEDTQLLQDQIRNQLAKVMVTKVNTLNQNQRGKCYEFSPDFGYTIKQGCSEEEVSKDIEENLPDTSYEAIFSAQVREKNPWKFNGRGPYPSMQRRALTVGLFLPNGITIKVQQEAQTSIDTDFAGQAAAGLAVGSHYGYVSLGFLEEVLNNQFKMKGKENSDSDIRYNFSDEWFTFNKSTLYNQIEYRGNKGFKWLYPDHRTVSAESEGEEAAGRIPLDQVISYNRNLVKSRYLFIDATLVFQALRTANPRNMKTVLQNILQDVNESSGNIFNLALTSGGKAGGNELKIIDLNRNPYYYNESYGNNKGITEIQVFNNNSIVTDFQMSFDMPNDSTSAYLAFGEGIGTSPIYDEKLKKAFMVRDLYQDYNSNKFIEYWGNIDTEDVLQTINETDSASQPDEKKLSLEEKVDAVKGQLKWWERLYQGDEFSKAYSHETSEQMVNETNSDLNVATQVNNDSEKKDEEVTPLENGYSSDAECPDWTIHPGIIDNFKVDAEKDLNYRQNSGNPFLNIDVSFTMPGLSGLNVGNRFSVSYLPETYKNQIFFIISSIKNQVQGGKWTTSVTGMMKYYEDVKMTPPCSPVILPYWPQLQSYFNIPADKAKNLFNLLMTGIKKLMPDGGFTIKREDEGKDEIKELKKQKVKEFNHKNAWKKWRRLKAENEMLRKLLSDFMESGGDESALATDDRFSEEDIVETETEDKTEENTEENQNQRNETEGKKEETESHNKDKDPDQDIDTTPVPGCIDPNACNFNPAATEDDGSCQRKDCKGECGGGAYSVPIYVDFDQDGRGCDKFQHSVCVAASGAIDGGDIQFWIDQYKNSFPEHMQPDISLDMALKGGGSCDDVPEITPAPDKCGVPGGDDSSCTGCDDPYSLTWGLRSDNGGANESIFCTGPAGCIVHDQSACTYDDITESYSIQSPDDIMIAPDLTKDIVMVMLIELDKRIAEVMGNSNVPESIRKEYEKIKGNYGQYKLTNAINGITSHHFNYINYKRRRRIKFQLIKTTQKGDKHYRVEFLLGKNTEMTLDRMKTFLDHIAKLTPDQKIIYEDNPALAVDPNMTKGPECTDVFSFEFKCSDPEPPCSQGDPNVLWEWVKSKMNEAKPGSVSNSVTGCGVDNIQEFRSQNDGQTPQDNGKVYGTVTFGDLSNASPSFPWQTSEFRYTTCAQCDEPANDSSGAGLPQNQANLDANM